MGYTKYLGSQKNLKSRNKLERLLKTNLKRVTAKNIYLGLYSSLDEFTKRVQEIYNELGVEKSDKMTIKELKDIYEYTIDGLNKSVLSYEDVTPFMYLKEKGLINGSLTYDESAELDNIADFE